MRNAEMIFSFLFFRKIFITHNITISNLRRTTRFTCENIFSTVGTNYLFPKLPMAVKKKKAAKKVTKKKVAKKKVAKKSATKKKKSKR